MFLERANVFVKHVAIHFFFYSLPRWTRLLLIVLLSNVFNFIRGKRTWRQLFTSDERETEVMTSAEMTEKLSMKNFAYKDPLYGGHMHTIYASFRPSRRVNYERELIEARDKAPIALDWLRLPRERQADTAKGILLVSPGFGNYSQTPYIQQLARLGVEQGYHVCVLNSRGSGSAPLLYPYIFTLTFSDDTEDVLTTVLSRESILRDYGRALPVIMVGYSAGCTIALKAAARFGVDGKETALAGIVCISGTYDLYRRITSVNKSPNKEAFQPLLMGVMRKFAAKHAKVLRKGLPNLPQEVSDNFAAHMERTETYEDLERTYSAPYMGLASVNDYYDAANSLNLIRKAGNIPIICVASKEDPIAGVPIPKSEWEKLIAEKPSTVYVLTPTGGHLGYVCGPIDELRERPSFMVTFPVECADAIAAMNNKQK